MRDARFEEGQQFASPLHDISVGLIFESEVHHVVEIELHAKDVHDNFLALGAERAEERERGIGRLRGIKRIGRERGI